MPLSSPANRGDIAPRQSELHRRTRWRNLAILGALVGLMVVFYLVTVVRIQTGLDVAAGAG